MPAPASLPASFHDSTDGARLHSLVVQDTERLDVMAKALLAIVIPALFLIAGGLVWALRRSR